MAGILGTENKVLMQQAREALAGKWGLAVIAFVLYLAIGIVVQRIPKAGPLIWIFIVGPFILGTSIFSLAISRDRNPRFEQIFHGFKRFGVSLGAYLLFMSFVILWAILLIIPGIMAAFSYSITFLLIADDEKIGPLEAIKKSKKMMYGYRWKLFCLYLRFLGWALLCILTFGIGFLWLMPYMAVSFAKFYDDLLNIQNPQVKEEEAVFTFEQ